VYHKRTKELDNITLEVNFIEKRSNCLDDNNVFEQKERIKLV